MTFAATVLTLYPEMFPGPLGVSLAGRALAEGKWSMDAVQIRDFAADKHRTVDDTPAGGGAGMVLRVDVLAKAVDFARGTSPLSFRGGAGVGGSPDRATALRDSPHPNPSPEGEGLATPLPVIALTPRGKPLTQERVRQLAAGPGVILLCGRFEGFDERIFDGRDVEEVSVGDIVLSGGECAALMLLDACIRLLPGVMGAALSGHEESFENGLLEYPHYTRPAEWEGRVIPEVLRSGDHAKIAEWRKRRSEDDTRLRRPDLWERHIGARVQPASGAQREVQDLKNEPDSAA
ncbi:tRNA (guanine37-N1)-methyltransferase [Novosphingobium hassiacum]|uniref:tRNA (guanine-N(1)-)-methyltransferase n=1 Tax=Novosphingobium hassiacum TaxID=173676 RepID=A0A7W5ZTG3_9SPHN|nr:tRNA (guanosine(37)-N1)-methyltransferase TrmD [Novosphingobium hassiacum]MBB3858924.1 tRNA (guanine37-N1)-methyltransferase [Novosphingobium hassiacum]